MKKRCRYGWKKEVVELEKFAHPFTLNWIEPLYKDEKAV